MGIKKKYFNATKNIEIPEAIEEPFMLSIRFSEKQAILVSNISAAGDSHPLDQRTLQISGSDFEEYFGDTARAAGQYIRDKVVDDVKLDEAPKKGIFAILKEKLF